MTETSDGAVYRLLTQADADDVQRFLGEHADASMFLRSNSRAAGLDYRGQPLGAQYFGAFERGALVAVVAHGWNDVLLVQAPRHAGALATATVRHSARRVAGVIGPLAQVRQAREALGLAAASPLFDQTEVLYALDLASLHAPPAADRGRRARPDEVRLLAEWHASFRRELRLASERELRVDRIEQSLRHQVAAGDVFVLPHPTEARLVACSLFNAKLPDSVQIGGVFTPPAERAQGYARAVVAQSLRLARAEGVKRAILFTGQESRWARRAYEALGFANIGDYGLVMF